MNNDKVFQMNFGKVYGLLLDKATRKGRTKAEVDEVICWLTGYSPEQLEAFRPAGLCYGDFFRKAPPPNPHRVLIKGVVCGVRRLYGGRPDRPGLPRRYCLDYAARWSSEVAGQRRERLYHAAELPV